MEPFYLTHCFFKSYWNWRYIPFILLLVQVPLVNMYTISLIPISNHAIVCPILFQPQLEFSGLALVIPNWCKDTVFQIILFICFYKRPSQAKHWHKLFNVGETTFTVSFKKTGYERICMCLSVLLMLNHLLWSLIIRHHHHIPMILVSFIIKLKSCLSL